jgi:hypothetical protein
MKNAVFWDVAPCRSCVKRQFTQDLHVATSQKTAFFAVFFLFFLVPKLAILIQAVSDPYKFIISFHLWTIRRVLMPS